MNLRQRIQFIFVPGLIAFVICSLLPGISLAQYATNGQGSQKAAPSRQPQQVAGSVPLQKYVSEQATFVLYAPKGWRVTEGAQPAFKTVSAADPSGAYEVALFTGTSPAGNDITALARRFVEGIGRQFPDLQLRNVMLSPDKTKITFEGAYTGPKRARKEFRTWITLTGSPFSYQSIEAPEGQLAAAKPLLLTILSNIRVMKGGFSDGGASKVEQVAFAPYRLRDGSASFQMPQGWQCQEFGKGAFVASDPAHGRSFIVSAVELISPQMRVNVPGVITAPYMPPRQAWPFITGRMGLATNMQFEKVIPRQDLVQQMAQVYTGTLTIEEMLYTFDSKTGRSKGYTMGLSFGARMGTNWTFRHMTVAAPADGFDAFLPNFVTMLQSYRIDDRWAANYVAQGMQRLRQLQQQTSAMVARNASEIHQMMQAAYDERQRSQEYIDYQRTSYIRGQQDWVSSMEGGTVYRSDSWGMRNMTTGEYYEGKYFDYYHSTGGNPKYNEQMQPIDSRALWEKHIEGRH
jgi:hypothetical protein